jgi:hypothetical protein
MIIFVYVVISIAGFWLVGRYCAFDFSFRNLETCENPYDALLFEMAAVNYLLYFTKASISVFFFCKDHISQINLKFHEPDQNHKEKKIS